MCLLSRRTAFKQFKECHLVLLHVLVEQAEGLMGFQFGASDVAITTPAPPQPEPIASATIVRKFSA